MAIELTTASPATLNNIRATLSAANIETQTIVATTSARTFIDGGNSRGQTLSLGTNDAYHFRLKSNNSSNRVTILSSGEVGIGTTLAQTRIVQLNSVTNGNFSDVTGMTPNGSDWFYGTIPSWTKGRSDTQFEVNLAGANYIVNVNGTSTGPGANSLRQSLGVLPAIANISLSFENTGTFGATTILSAAIVNNSFVPIVSGAFDAVGTYTLVATGVPAGTPINVSFWGQAGVDNVSVTVDNASVCTIAGGLSSTSASVRKLEVVSGVINFSNLPISSAGLPRGSIWNDSGTLKIV